MDPNGPGRSARAGDRDSAMLQHLIGKYGAQALVGYLQSYIAQQPGES
jgi:hypothetical protein